MVVIVEEVPGILHITAISVECRVYWMDRMTMDGNRINGQVSTLVAVEIIMADWEGVFAGVGG